MLKFTGLFECERADLVGSSEWRRFLLEKIRGVFCCGLRGILSVWIGNAVAWILIVYSLYSRVEWILLIYS